jgi:hypothetical protein
MNNKVAAIVLPLVFIAGLGYEHVRMLPQVDKAVQDEAMRTAALLFDCNSKIMESEELRTQDQISCREWACYDTLEIICLEAKHPKACKDRLAYACQKIYEEGH